MKPLGGGGQGNRSRLTKARGLTRFRLKGRIEFETVTAQAGQVFRSPQLTHEARCVPGGAAGIPITLEQQDIADPQLSQVIGNARTDNPAANDDHLRLIR